MNTDQPCHHCGADSPAFAHLLEETEHFRVICDIHPLCEGHILIVPKEHISCIGACDDAHRKEFLPLYNRCKTFVHDTYGSVSTFEHGIVGQTVFHAHVHLLPYADTPGKIVPEGTDHMTAVPG